MVVWMTNRNNRRSEDGARLKQVQPQRMNGKWRWKQEVEMKPMEMTERSWLRVA